MSRSGARPGASGLWRHGAVAGLLAGAMVVLLLSSHQLSMLRKASWPLRRATGWLDHFETPFDMTHVAFFALLGITLRLLLPKARWWQLLLGFALLAGSTELLQFFTEGRTPKLLDVRDDLVGTCIGLLAGSLPLLLLRWWRRGGVPSTAPEPAGIPDTRRRLARLIAGNPSDGNDGSDLPDHEGLIALATDEGVTALLAASLCREGCPPPHLPRSLAERARALAKVELGQHAALVVVLARLHAAGIPVLVLKGTALRSWLYPQPYLRESSDLDLLFATREDAMRAVAVLDSLGYGAPYIPGRFAHEILCRHPANRVDLDLHWRLSRNPAMEGLPDFHALLGRAQSLPALGGAAFGLGAVDALLHACVHRASNLEGGLADQLKWLYDVHLLASRFDDDEWCAFVAACGEARIHGIARDALHASSSLFGTVLRPAAMALLQAGIHQDVVDSDRLQDWAYMQLRSLQALKGWGTRLAWLTERAFPPTGYMREIYGRDQSRASLLWLRLRRFIVRTR